MSSLSNCDRESSDNLPNLIHEINSAKTYLQTQCSEFGNSLYDHLAELLNKILSERPENALLSFEDYSRQLKNERFNTQVDHLRDVYVPPAEYEEAKKLLELFQVDITAKETDENLMKEYDEDDDTRQKPPNLSESFYYFQQVGVGLPRSEIILLNLSVRKLMSNTPIQNVRFWGKILGSPKNYFIVEANLQDEELERRLEQLDVEERSKRERARSETQELAVDKKEAENETPKVEPIPEIAGTKINGHTVHERSSKIVIPSLPENLWNLSVKDVPPERLGSGANTKVYFVCNSPGLDDWIELPPVTPEQIVVARQTVQYFSGNLANPIYTYPPFPGTEKNYLRAQIARISATTLISPVGYFTFGGEEDEDIEEEEGTDILEENTDYQPFSIRELVDPSMSNWCHHSPYLLKQGRVVWSDPEKSIGDDDEGTEEEIEESEDEEDEGEINDDRKEAGPSLLTPLSEDVTIDSVPPWTARQSSKTRPETAVALVRSNVWPGAFAFATGRLFGNVYIGWGYKYTAFNYSPPRIPSIEDEYKFGAEIMEVHDVEGGGEEYGEGETYHITNLPQESASDEGKASGMQNEQVLNEKN